MLQGADLIEQMISGRFRDSETGTIIEVPIRSCLIEPSLAGSEGDLVLGLAPGRKLAIVCDADTYEVLGRRVEDGLRDRATVTLVNLGHAPHPDDETVGRVMEAVRGQDLIVAVGSGTINDLSKMSAARLSLPFVVFPTAASMNGYSSVNAAITVAGHKKSLSAAAPLAIFADLGVIAAAPRRLTISGIGDSLCRTTAQADWLLAHGLRGIAYRQLPFDLLFADEASILAQPEALVSGDTVAVASLVRTLILSGLGMTICGSSMPASQGEHLISHYIEMMQGHGGHPSLHGEQIAVTTLTMAALQDRMLALDAPRLQPVRVERPEVLRHFGEEIGASCWQDFDKKQMKPDEIEGLNQHLALHWDEIRADIRRVRLPTSTLLDVLRRVGAPLKPGDLGWTDDFYRSAIEHARLIRDRYTFLDFAAEQGMLEGG